MGLAVPAAANKTSIAVVSPLPAGVQPAGTQTIPTTSTGYGTAFDVMPPYLTLTYCICYQGVSPTPN